MGFNSGFKGLRTGARRKKEEGENIGVYKVN